MILNIQHTEQLYAIDINEDFDSMGMYTFNHPPHRLKSESCFKGIALLRNPVEFEMKNSVMEKDIDMRNFMRLYFAEKELECFTNFPASILAVSEERFYRRYAVCTDETIEADDDFKEGI